MPQLIVTANKLNKRNSIPAKLPEPNGIIGTVNKGFTFEGTEFVPVPNAALGKWFMDRDGSFYWGGGIMVETQTPPNEVPAPGPVVNKPVVPVPQPVSETPANMVTFPGLPINLPGDFRLGVDVSHHNGNADWEGIKNAGSSFVFIKITDGVGTRDVKAKAHSDNAKQKGLRIGYYHFCHPDTRVGGTIISDATAEANEALQVISTLQKPDLPLVLDLETSGNSDSPLKGDDYLLWVNTFIAIIKNEGLDVIIYGNKSYLDGKLPVGHSLGKNKLWIAAYPIHPDLSQVKLPNGFTELAIWQYTESGVMGGNNPIDINVMIDSTLF